MVSVNIQVTLYIIKMIRVGCFAVCFMSNQLKAMVRPWFCSFRRQKKPGIGPLSPDSQRGFLTKKEASVKRNMIINSSRILSRGVTARGTVIHL